MNIDTWLEHIHKALLGIWGEAESRRRRLAEDRRERIATAVLAGIRAEAWHPDMGWSPRRDANDDAQIAVDYADALIALLDKPASPNPQSLPLASESAAPTGAPAPEAPAARTGPGASLESGVEPGGVL